LDILGKEANTGKSVAIENQLELTDHSHLGQLLTYSAGIDAEIVIWVASKFTEEHKKALEWLNENSSKEINFFGVEVHAIKIGDSKPAPDFRVIVEPNLWQKTLKESSIVVSESAKPYLEFYQTLAEEYYKKNSAWNKIKAQPQSWLAFGAGKGGITFAWAFKSGNCFGVDLYIDMGDKELNKTFFDLLYKHRDDIEKKVSGLKWERLDNKRASRITLVRKNKTLLRKMNDEEKKEVINWAIKNMKVFSETFKPLINKHKDDV